MGSSHRAHCQCGFDTNVTVGGGKYTFKEDSQFPYYCGSCGIVSVNIAKLKIDDQPPCPKCGGADVHQYGKHPVSIPVAEPQPASRWDATKKWLTNYPTAPTVSVNRRALQWGAWETNELDNLCPACKKMTLVFSVVSVMFD